MRDQITADKHRFNFDFLFVPLGGSTKGVALCLAAALYLVYWTTLITDPWSTWVHVETAYVNNNLQGALNAHDYRTLIPIVIDGEGIDPNPARFRPISNAVELFDAFARKGVSKAVGFNPSLINLSSLVYYLLTPVIAFLIARRLVRPNVIGMAGLVLSVGVFLTSVGYLSASIFAFHPGKKIVVLFTLAGLLFFLRWCEGGKTRDAVGFFLTELVLFWSDEVGIVAGGSIALLLGSYILWFGRPHIILFPLVGIQFIAIAPFCARQLQQWQGGDNLPGHNATLIELLTTLRLGEFISLSVDHLRGALSAHFGSIWISALLILSACAIMLASVVISAQKCSPIAARLPSEQRGFTFAEARFLLGASAALLAINVFAAVIFLKFGGSAYMSSYNYYYSSVLPVFAFFLIGAAVLVASQLEASQTARLIVGGLQFVFAGTLLICIILNVQYFSQFNRLIGMIHTNPYPYGAINEAGMRWLGMRGKEMPTTIQIPACTPELVASSFRALAEDLNVSATTTGVLVQYADHPMVTEQYLSAVFKMMIREENAPINVVDASPTMCSTIARRKIQ